LQIAVQVEYENDWWSKLKSSN